MDQSQSAGGQQQGRQQGQSQQQQPLYDISQGGHYGTSLTMLLSLLFRMSSTNCSSNSFVKPWTDLNFILGASAAVRLLFLLIPLKARKEMIIQRASSFS